MNGINLSGIAVGGRSNSSVSSSKSLLSSSNDLLAVEALALAAEQQLHMQTSTEQQQQHMHMQASSPPGSAPTEGFSSRAAANAHLILSPSKDSFLLEMKQQGSFSSGDFSAADLTTPGGFGPSNPVSPMPNFGAEEGPTTPSTVTNKAFKLIPQRRQQSNDSSGGGGSDYSISSPSSKLRSYSTSDAAGVNKTSASLQPSVGSAARPITGRRAGSSFGDYYDDEDDSYTAGNWRNITLDPSPSANLLNAAAAPASSTSRKISSASNSGFHSTNTSTKAPRREFLAPSRGSSSTSLGAGTNNSTSTTAVGNTSNNNEQAPSRKNERASSSSSPSVGRSAVSVLSSAAAAVANSLTRSGIPREDANPAGSGLLFSKPQSHYVSGHNTSNTHGGSFTPSAAASHTGIAAITPVTHDNKRNM